MSGAMRTLALCLAAALMTGPAMRAMAATDVLTGAEVVALGADGNGQVVTIEGEAIGDILRGGRDHVWVNVLSGGTAVGVWVPRSLASAIETLGEFRARGDTIRATGVFNFACDQHGGELDVHATEFSVVAPGEKTERPVHPYKLLVAAVLAAGAGLQAVLHRRSRKRDL